MQASDRIILVIMVLASGAFATAAVVNMLQEKHAEALVLKKQVLNVTAEEVIGQCHDFEGSSNSPYTLVEFGDYQCPPCHGVFKSLQNTLAQYKGTIKFSFRNLPLTSIHPYAMPAAIAAEAAREQGKFWSTYDALYMIDAADFDMQAVNNVIKKQALNKDLFQTACASTAKSVVISDISVAKKLSITSTPSFVLCCPNQKVIYLKSLDEIDKVVAENH